MSRLALNAERKSHEASSTQKGDRNNERLSSRCKTCQNRLAAERKAKISGREYNAKDKTCSKCGRIVCKLKDGQCSKCNPPKIERPPSYTQQLKDIGALEWVQRCRSEASRLSAMCRRVAAYHR